MSKSVHLSYIIIADDTRIKREVKKVKKKHIKSTILSGANSQATELSSATRRGSDLLYRDGLHSSWGSAALFSRNIAHSLKVRSHQMRMTRIAQMIYMLSQCKDNPAALFARMRRYPIRSLL